MQTAYRTSFTTLGGFFIDLSSAISCFLRELTDSNASLSEGKIFCNVSSH
jgi:hypothetical protein